MSRAHTGRVVTGPAGTATEVILDEAANADQTATVAAWFLHCPGQSPAWWHYTLGIVHLRDVVGQSKPPIIRVPYATHELFLLALDPARSPVADDPDTWAPLRPHNLAEQLELPDDAAAADLVAKAVEHVVAGNLWAEPPLSHQVEPWRTSLLKSAAHARGEEHAP